MRLNRVLLLAAVISMAMAAMVFTISCSGDDGKDGSSCTAVRKGDEGYSIQCGGVEQGFIPFTGVKGDQGEPGKDGTNCVFQSQSGNSATFNCDGTTVVIGGGSSGGGGAGCSIGQEDKYNVNEVKISCPGSDDIYLCAGKVFNRDSYVCYNGQDRNGFAANTGDKNYLLYNAGNVTSSALANSAPIVIDTVFKCGVSGATYDPNKYFCKGTATAVSGSTINYTPSAGDELIELCGGGDFNGSTQFCLQANFKAVVKKCGPSSGSPSSFSPNQFCQVPKLIVSGGNVSTSTTTAAGYTVNLPPYDSAVTTPYATKVADLCGSTPYGATSRIDLGTGAGGAGTHVAEILSTSFTGGEYWPSSVPGGVATAIVGSTSKYYINGTTICKDGVVLTHCKKNTNDSLFFNTKSHFCRDKSSKPADSLEVVDLCFKTSDPKKPGTIWDGINYQCNPETGDPARSCGPGTNYYDENIQFCYSPTNTVAVKCKDDPTQYNPDLAFCAYGGGTANQDTLYTVADTSKQVAVSKCGATKIEYNKNGWNWEYCTNKGTVNEGVLACGVNEEPESKTAVRCQCAKGLNAVKSLWTNTCFIPAAPGGSFTGDTNSPATSIQCTAALVAANPQSVTLGGFCCPAASADYIAPAAAVGSTPAVVTACLAPCATAGQVHTNASTAACVATEDVAVAASGKCTTSNVVTQTNGVKYCGAALN